MEEGIKPLPVVNAMVGVDVDVGPHDVAVLSTGEQMANPAHLHRGARMLAHAPRTLARRQNGSQNRENARVNGARIHARRADQRRDGLHQVTTRLIRAHPVIRGESLAVKHLVHTHALATASSAAGWGECGRAGAPGGVQSGVQSGVVRA